LRWQARSLAPDVLDLAGVAGVADVAALPLRTYSTGMRARLAFATATVVRPQILLIDEARGPLTARARRQVPRQPILA
jgi:teichoic acid transport system ATP-binding protein